jgi:heptaprenyl diphosphate synthase
MPLHFRTVHSSDNTIENKPNRQKLTAGFAALAICIHLFESTLPSVMGIKPGLANVITLIVLLRYGLKMAVHVQLLRVFIASLLNGSLFGPTFFLSLCGSLAALCMLAIIYTIFKALLFSDDEHVYPYLEKWMPGAITYSVIAAIAHMLGQFLLAYLWLIPHTGLFKLLPVLLLLALAFGWVNGIMAHKVLSLLHTRADKLQHA